ncbi:MAG: (Fe-S)-binding protein [Syntrophobacteraceae bacterium]
MGQPPSLHRFDGMKLLVEFSIFDISTIKRSISFSRKGSQARRMSFPIDGSRGLVSRSGGKEIDPNFKSFSPLSVLDVLRLLPRMNCRQCGFATCMAFAAALSRGKTSHGGCLPDSLVPCL